MGLIYTDHLEEMNKLLKRLINNQDALASIFRNTLDLWKGRLVFGYLGSMLICDSPKIFLHDISFSHVFRCLGKISMKTYYETEASYELGKTFGRTHLFFLS